MGQERAPLHLRIDLDPNNPEPKEEWEWAVYRIGNLRRAAQLSKYISDWSILCAWQNGRCARFEDEMRYLNHLRAMFGLPPLEEQQHDNEDM